jgi:uncharacterized protein YbaA (DUF1428 family)
MRTCPKPPAERNNWWRGAAAPTAPQREDSVAMREEDDRRRRNMTYIEGFVIAVPTANKDKFIDHAKLGDSVFLDHGATRVLECWQDNVEKGHTTDFFGAVDAREDESVVFSWIEWPDKASRQAMMGRMEELMKTDDRFNPEKNPMPFDGARMIYGGFQPIVEQGEATPGAYVQGFVLPSPSEKKEAYRKMAEEAWTMFKDYGALRVIEAWQDDVPEGKQTDFFRAVKAEPGENVIFSFMEWPSREVCDEAAKKMEADDSMQMPEEMPFNPQRMIYGGFRPVVELTRENVGG